MVIVDALSQVRTAQVGSWAGSRRNLPTRIDFKLVTTELNDVGVVGTAAVRVAAFAQLEWRLK